MDKYYTNPIAADKLIKCVLPYIGKYPLILEPSAGAGNISLKLIPELDSKQRLISIDIDPEHTSIEKMDFLKDDLPLNEPTLVIGNPPFSRGAAISFFNRAALYLKVSMIAFIVPASWRKPSVQDRLSHNFCLIHEQSLPSKSFIDPKGKDYHKPSVIQVWTRCFRPYRKKALSNGNYEFLSLDVATQFTFCFRRIGTYAGEVFLVDKFQRTSMSLGSFYFLELSPALRLQTTQVIKLLRESQWSKDDVAGAPSISKEELIIRMNHITTQLSLTSKLNDVNSLFDESAL